MRVIVFVWFWSNFDPKYCTNNTFRFEGYNAFFRLVMRKNFVQLFSWQPLKTSVQSSSTHCYNSTLSGVSRNSPSWHAKESKCHWRLPLVDAIMSTHVVSNGSTYWPLYGLNTYGLFLDSSNPYGTTHSFPSNTNQSISRELRIARLNRNNTSFTARCVPSLMRWRGYALCMTDSISF